VDGNTDDKQVQETFISTLAETIKDENFPVFHRYHDDGDNVNTNIHQVDPKKQTTSAAVAEHVVSGPAVPRQNGHLPNKTNEDNDNQGHLLRYDVRNMYAQIGSYENEPTL